MWTPLAITQRNDGAHSPPRDIGLYIHIPFCHTKCPYCDFNTYAGIEALMPGYIEALAREIRCWGALLGAPQVNTIFFGGGTPSYVPRQAIADILDAVHDVFRVAPDAEVTIEANPGDLLDGDTASLHEAGVNRLSIGVQSLDDSLLETLGRRHTSQEAVTAYREVRRAGFGNVSLDLMYGLPYQSLAQWRDTLEQALELSPDHLSLYCLTLEGGTPMERQVSQGEMPEPDPDLAADMYALAEDMLAASGYRHYEISNWARPGMESRHNLTYWLNKPYLGVGPGAHSYLGEWRFQNINSPREYIGRLRDAATQSPQVETLSSDALLGIPCVGSTEAIDRRLEMAETMMMGMRLNDGISLEDFYDRFGENVTSVYGKQVEDLTSLGLIEQIDGALRLTSRGRPLGNEVFLRFV